MQFVCFFYNSCSCKCRVYVTDICCNLYMVRIVCNVFVEVTIQLVIFSEVTLFSAPYQPQRLAGGASMKSLILHCIPINLFISAACCNTCIIQNVFCVCFPLIEKFYHLSLVVYSAIKALQLIIHIKIFLGNKPLDINLLIKALQLIIHIKIFLGNKPLDINLLHKQLLPFLLVLITGTNIHKCVVCLNNKYKVHY